jgi:nicotinate-nucleotide pyrophosphorylase (carboxylating)
MPPAGAPWNADVARAARVLARTALDEDHAFDDRTSRALPAPGRAATVSLVAREACTLAGVPLVGLVYGMLSPGVEVQTRASDGTQVDADELVATIAGPAAALLSGERTVLNFLQRLSGIATLTRRFVTAVEGTGTAIVDTRKTTPGLRLLEKYAVRCGGGVNHRMHLGDMVMLKDNHVALSGVPLGELVTRVTQACPDLPLACEADTLEQVAQLCTLPVDLVMLDNMTPEDVRRATKLLGGRITSEVTGGVTLDNVREYAATGVDRISIGALTHSARAVDLGIDTGPAA